MRFEFDEEANALYIRLREAPVARTREIEAGTLVDLDRRGYVVGVEVLRPARSWPVEEVVHQFRVRQADAALIRSLWGRRAGLFPLSGPGVVSRSSLAAVSA